MPSYKTMTELATQALRSAIFSGELPPGTMLVPKTLESRLDLGKMAIREAIRELIGSGLVKALPNKGAFVAQPPMLEEIREIYGLRKRIEKKISVRAAARIRATEIDRLEALHRLPPHPPGGRVIGHGVGMLALQLHELTIERVVVAIGYLRPILDVVESIVLTDEPTKLVHAGCRRGAWCPSHGARVPGNEMGEK